MKLLNLRKRDDDNEVKVTVAGLSKLLALNINTVRSALRSLCDKGFLLNLGDVTEEGVFYPKRIYSFPETFPGFNAKEVFIRRGDKQKAKVRKDWDRQRAEADRRQKVSVKVPVQKAKTMVGVHAKGSTLRAKDTPPKTSHFIDRALIKVGMKNTSYSSPLPPNSNFESVPSPHLPSATAVNGERTNLGKQTGSKFYSQLSLETAGAEESKPLPSIVSLQPNFRSLILSVLTQIRQREYINRMVGFIDKLARDNPAVKTPQDRTALAIDLEEAFKTAFLASGPAPRKEPEWKEPKPRKTGYNQLLDRMYNFFRRFVSEYPDS